MSKRSEDVKRWRNKCKARMVEAMGGQCCVCGYNRCNDALVFHHLDPSQKNFSFGKVRANPISWTIIVNELRKCILVCANCHFEIHAELITAPPDAPKFDERFVDYRTLENPPKPLTPCPVCGKLKQPHLINCSNSCAMTARFNIPWDSFDLVERLKTTSMVALAKELGCSDRAISKRLKKLGLK